MGIPSDYKKYMSNYVPPSPLKKRAGRKKKKREKKRNGVIQQLQVNNKGIISDDLPEIRVVGMERKPDRKEKARRARTVRDGKPEGKPGKELTGELKKKPEHPRVMGSKKNLKRCPEGNRAGKPKEEPEKKLERKPGRIPERKLKKELGKKPEEKTDALPGKTSFLDFFLSLCDILGAVCLILCILAGFYHDISQVSEAGYQTQTAVQLVDVTRTGTKCIDGYMYDAFTMEIAGDKTFYAPENSIKWNKEGIGKKRCTINTMTVSDSFSFTESPFFFAKTRETIGGTENFGDQLKTGDTISVSVSEHKSWFLISRYQVDVHIIRQQYSFEGDNSFTEKEIQDSKEMAEKLCKKKRANVTSSFHCIFSQRVHVPENRYGSTQPRSCKTSRNFSVTY